MNLSISFLIKGEIEKMPDVGFILSINCFSWISKIVSIFKEDNKIHMFTEFQYLNKASLKDDFPLPNIDMTVD